MKSLVVLFALIATVLSKDEYCYSTVQDFCSPTKGSLTCNAKFGAIDSALPDLQKYANKHISNSFDFLLLSTHFSNYEKNRPGFEKLFRKLSDEKWNDAVDLMKHITQRGGEMDFTVRELSGEKRTYELSELESLAKALDIEKSLANQANHIHDEITRTRINFHDAVVGHYLEEELLDKQAKNIRQLSGFSNDLSNLLSTNNEDNSLTMFLFDEYLQKL